MEREKKAGVVQYNGYVAGWLSSSIEEFVGVLPRNTQSAAYALITCLDSCSEPASVLQKSAKLRAAMNGVGKIRNGLLIPTKSLQNASIRSQLFVGFDEIWFFPTDEIEPKPESTSIVGPHRISQETLEKVGPWMEKHGCSLALGDGEGLNILVKAYGLVRNVIAHSLTRPEQAFQSSEMWVENEEEKPQTPRPSKLRKVRRALTS